MTAYCIGFLIKLEFVFWDFNDYHIFYRLLKIKAEVAELVDALGSGPSDRKVVGVQIPPSAF